MLKQFLIALALLLVVATPALAQSTQQFSDPTYNSTPNNLDTGGTVTTDNENRFDWRWLLPLLAVPIVYFAWKSRDQGDYTTYNDQYAVGVKGGKVEKRSEVDTMGTDDDVVIDERI